MLRSAGEKDGVIDAIHAALDALESSRAQQPQPSEHEAVSDGVYPTMITPFRSGSLAVDWERLDGK